MNYETISAFLITLLYFQAVFHKNLILTPKGLQNKLIKQIPILFYKIIIIIVMLLEFVAPILITYSTINTEYREYGKYAIQSLIGFTILATLIYHKPFTGSFYSHLSIIGGLIALLLVFNNKK